MNKHHYVAIMAGGIGSRFWPLSRTKYPKQFLDILGTGETLLQSTYNRFKEFMYTSNIFIVTSDEYTELVKKQLPDIKDENILSEPSRKNTAPCIAYMAFKLLQIDPKASFIVAPADHLIMDNLSFKQNCNKALRFVEKNNFLVTLGIKPTYPNTGYGYIQYNNSNQIEDGIYHVKTFTEKPELELAKTFISSGEFLWNAGIFIWTVKDILYAMEQFMPEMFELFMIEKDNFNTSNEKKSIDHIYPQCVNVSIDIGIMEKALNVCIIPSGFGWSDLGTWNSAYENMEKDYFGNAVQGNNVMIIDATKNMVHTENNKMVVLQGLNDYVIVDKKDVLLICKKEKEQDIKDYLAEVKRSKGDKFL